MLLHNNCLGTAGDAKDFAPWLENVMHTPTFKTAAR